MSRRLEKSEPSFWTTENQFLVLYLTIFFIIMAYIIWMGFLANTETLPYHIGSGFR